MYKLKNVLFFLCIITLQQASQASPEKSFLDRIEELTSQIKIEIDQNRIQDFTQYSQYIIPLHMATTVNAVDAILKFRPDKNDMDNQGFTPVDRMVQRRDFDTAMYLVSIGGSGNHQSVKTLFNQITFE